MLSPLITFRTNYCSTIKPPKTTGLKEYGIDVNYEAKKEHDGLWLDINYSIQFDDFVSGEPYSVFNNHTVYSILRWHTLTKEDLFLLLQDVVERSLQAMIQRGTREGVHFADYLLALPSEALNKEASNLHRRFQSIP